MGFTKSDIKQVPRQEIKIVTSWDDGGKLDLRIADLLSVYGLSGTFNVVLNNIGKPGFMSWDDIKRLDERFKIGSHTVSHPPDLKALFDEELFIEIQTSKDLIEAALGHNIESFCYPRGRSDERVRAKVIEAGYLEARGTGKPGIITVEDVFYLPGTIHVFQREEYGSDSILEYAKGVFQKLKKQGGYCNIWGHSAEIERTNNWAVLEDVFKEAQKCLS